ncbi:MAG TPA: molybdate ABC transporter substrate-binding protein [Rhizomicrobium sp.]|nr:molybdate ABC transporter substrate-binding protein [Rhizomicrobium sp.]
MSINRRIAVFAALPALYFAPAQAQTPVTVFAAASLTDSLKSVADAYKARTGIGVVLSFGASSTLARQIEQGAKADLFFSADADWMDYLQQKGLITAGTRKNLLGNRLVLIAASDARPVPRIAPGFDLAGALGDGRLALADPDSVPAGKYAKAALTALGVWDNVASKVARAENVRVALEYVARGEAPYGIVYATDAKVTPQLRVAGVFPQNSHAPIVYPTALTKSAAPGARAFLEFLGSAEARAIFAKAGFMPR